eukprot:Phypoly_transcript_12855.p1 GENE.Phypoly_transcript_12855~~Phypoly_transcript_12855.p1  ORF type:complete len:329 (+),score=32.87 Phypoly_transcript_12855:86-1072(+)
MLSEKQWTYKGEYVKVFKDGQWLPGKVKRTYFYGSKALSSVSISYWRQGTILERWCEDFELLSPQWRRDPFWRHNRSSLSIQNYYQHVDHFLEAETVPPPAYRAIYSGGKQWKKKKNAPYHIARHKMPIYNSFLPENPVGIPCKSRKNPIYNTSSLTEPPFLSTEPNFKSPEPVFLPSEPAFLPTEPAFLPSEPTLISPEPLITPETTFLPTEPAFFDTEPAIISPEPTSLPSEPTTAPLPEITETHAHSPNQENLAPNSSNSGLPDSHSEESVSVVIDLCLYFYVNILSENGEIRTEVGPQVVVLSSSDKVLSGPLPSPFVCSTFSA